MQHVPPLPVVIPILCLVLTYNYSVQLAMLPARYMCSAGNPSSGRVINSCMLSLLEQSMRINKSAKVAKQWLEYQHMYPFISGTCLFST